MRPGAQNGQTATDGLYQGPTALSMDVVNVLRRIKLLGFNAVRLPFSMQNLVNQTARDFHYTNCQNIAQADVINSVINPAIGVPSGVNLSLPAIKGLQCLLSV